ncbi:unnamed protein product [Rotaria magnacalcarata]|uniref:Uncharacterized protein n=1 Tax=Rotaria magnacalcarata TaxID=392030 RepID=A0A8S3FFW1_9BILA|nr:unnamed protein product [Rotaria magnacalcarata]
MIQARSVRRPYSNHTLINNWLEERADVKNERIQKPLPSQNDHYFGTTYECGYGTIRGDPPRPEVRNLESESSH